MGDAPRATELEYLRWMWSWADFGPADSDVREAMKARFIEEEGKIPPEGWYCCPSCGEDEANTPECFDGVMH